MTSSVREQLEELNRECEEFCIDQANWSDKWHGTDDNGNPNFLIAYSSAETFERMGGVMFLGTNPGGDHHRAKAHPFRLPFERQRWSSYLDDDWGNPHGKQWPMQIAVRKVAEVLAGKPNMGDRLLRSSPSGNLVPFRSQSPNDLPDLAYRKGLEIGWHSLPWRSRACWCCSRAKFLQIQAVGLVDGTDRTQSEARLDRQYQQDTYLPRGA